MHCCLCFVEFFDPSETLKKCYKVKWYVRRVYIMDDGDELIPR